MKSFATPEKGLCFEDLGHFKAAREMDSDLRNPTNDYKASGTGDGEAVLMWQIMKNPKTDCVPLDWLDSLYIDEKLPVHLGWYPPQETTLLSHLYFQKMRFPNVKKEYKSNPEKFKPASSKF